MAPKMRPHPVKQVPGERLENLNARRGFSRRRKGSPKVVPKSGERTFSQLHPLITRGSKRAPTAHLENHIPKKTEKVPKENFHDKPSRHASPTVGNTSTQGSKKRPAPPTEETYAKRQKLSSTLAPVKSTAPVTGPSGLWPGPATSGEDAIPRSLTPAGPSLPRESTPKIPPICGRPPSIGSGFPLLDAVPTNILEETTSQPTPQLQKKTARSTVPVVPSLIYKGQSMPVKSRIPSRRKRPTFHQSLEHLPPVGIGDLGQAAPPQFVFRAFHSGSGSKYSSGGFRSTLDGTRPNGDGSIRKCLIRHFDKRNRVPTPWISATDDLLRALNIACNWQHEGKEGISIAVISTRFSGRSEVHSAQALSVKHKLKLSDHTDPVLRKTEWLFRFEVPKEAVKPCLPLQTLLSQGLYRVVPALDVGSQQWGGGPVSLDEMRVAVKESVLQESGRGPFTDEGRTAGEVALLFGRGEHRKLIVRQVLRWRMQLIRLEDFEVKYVERAIQSVLVREK